MIRPAIEARVASKIARMIREANHPDRKAFRDPKELLAWLGEVLTPLERARLAELLEERAPAPASGRTPKPGAPSTRGHQRSA